MAKRTVPSGRACECGTDISHKHPNASRCDPCQAEHRRIRERVTRQCLDCGLDLTGTPRIRRCAECASKVSYVKPRPERTCLDCDRVISGKGRKRCEKHRQQRARELERRWRENNRETLAAAVRASQRKHPDRVRETERRYRENNPEMVLLRNARVRAREKGLEYKLTRADITIPERCAVYGLELVRNTRGRGALPNSMSIDRIDNTKGYLPGNVHVISHIANAHKGERSLSELAGANDPLGRWARKQLGLPVRWIIEMAA